MKGGCSETLSSFRLKRVDLVGAREGAADRPGDALGADPLVDAEAVEDLEALLRVADAARRRARDADGVVLVEDDDGDAAQRQVAGERQAGEAAAGDDDRIAAAARAPPRSGGATNGQLGSS